MRESIENQESQPNCSVGLLGRVHVGHDRSVGGLGQHWQGRFEVSTRVISIVRNTAIVSSFLVLSHRSKSRESMRNEETITRISNSSCQDEECVSSFLALHHQSMRNEDKQLL